METRVAIISIVVDDSSSVEELNQILHQYGTYIIGRMGIPYQKREISLISVAMDAPSEIISAVTGKIGMLTGVTSKAVYSKLPAQM
ncbi:MAG: TM1266 family iron-only hydrogenase system putative regulator [Lachnospiraceae bacterium]